MTRAEAYLRQVLARQELGHAYYLEAARPGEAEEVMDRAARLIACEKGTGCGTCASCRAFDSGNHPDIIRLTKAKPAYSTKEIREQLVSDIGIRPYRFARKIYLIPEADTLTPVCQNIMLKTMEEPPSYGVILLAGINRNVFLPTLLSRMVCLSAEETEGAAQPDGSGGGTEELLRTAEELDGMSAAGCMEVCARLKKAGLEPDLQAVRFGEMLRDIYTAKGGAPDRLHFPDRKKLWLDYADRLSDRRLKELWEALQQVKKQLRLNIKAENVIASFCLSFRDALSESEEL